MEGWQAALLLVAIVATAAALVVPRPVLPPELPLPQVDRGEQRLAAGRDAERIRSARERALTYEVRAVGEAVRRLGLAEGSTGAAHDDALRTLRRATLHAREQAGVEPLLTLCAIQSDLFLRALAAWESGQPPSQDLEELGGAFLSGARRRGWLAEERQLVLTEAERRLLFRMRWLELTGLRKQPGAKPTLNEWRAYYRILLERGHGDVEGRLDVVGALDKLDAEYPAELARGLLLLRLGDRDRAIDALRAHLAGPRGSFWRLRARNALAAAIGG